MVLLRNLWEKPQQGKFGVGIEPDSESTKLQRIGVKRYSSKINSSPLLSASLATLSRMRFLPVLSRPLLRASGREGVGVGVGARARPQVQSCISSTRAFTTSPSLSIDRRRLAGQIKIKTIDDKIAELNVDENIDSVMVIVKNEDGTLGQPEPLYALLNTIDRKTQYVLQLTRPGDFAHPIVRIAERQELVNLIRKKEDNVRNAQLAEKEKKAKQLELNWAISGNDLLLKLKQMDAFLLKGKKVELLLAAKRHQRKATMEEAAELLKNIKDKVNEVPGTHIAKMDGSILKQMTILVQREKT